MRKILFRAWNGRRMINPYCELDDQTKNFYSEFFDEVHSVMQFTNMHDKNDHPIFEGDIMQHGDKRHLVEWGDNCYILKKISIGLTTDGVGHNFDDGEVIGNIHEHPDLLNHAT